MSAEERIERLEREIVGIRRRARCLLVSGLGMMGALLVLPGYKAQDPKVVRAERFEVMDKDGKIRAALGMYKEGPLLHLADENGKVRAALGIENNVSWLTLRDENKRLRAELSAGKNGPGLNLYDESGERLAGAGQQPRAAPQKAVAGKAVWRKLKKGMTAADVRELLGEPEKIEAGGTLTYWYYDKKNASTLGAHVVFESDKVTVYGWQEPD